MKTTILGLLAETSLHTGAGRSSGIVDLPIAREAATDYPYIPGSSLKGALRDRARERGKLDVTTTFGSQNQAGKLLVSDARILLLPVRSLEGAYRWVTSPLALERYQRDLKRSGSSRQILLPSPPADGQVLGHGDGVLHLEEREFAVSGPVPQDIHEAMCTLVLHEETKKRLAEQIAIVSDHAFAWFCRYAIPVQTRNQLAESTKTSENLWYEESLPPDTLLYALAVERDETTPERLHELFDEQPYLQVGGNETVGHGWTAVSRVDGGAP